MERKTISESWLVIDISTRNRTTSKIVAIVVVLDEGRDPQRQRQPAWYRLVPRSLELLLIKASSSHIVALHSSKDICFCHLHPVSKPLAQLKMRLTSTMLAKGFFGRSIDEFKRLSVIGTQLPLSSRPY